MAKWTIGDMARQDGRRAVVTGTGGLGFEVARALARAGAIVVIAGRDALKGADAVARIRSDVAAANVRFEALDLASLASVARFAERLGKDQQQVDLLVNNAGVMVPPARRETADGFELQFGTNHLGHFAPKGRDRGYLVVSSQGDNAYTLYALPGVTYAGRFRIGGGAIDATSETDGIDLVLGDFGRAYPGGLMVAQDGDNAPATQNFKYASWAAVRRALRLR